MVLRGEYGELIFSACRFLDVCTGPLQAELEACREGILQTRHFSDRPCVVEMDSCEAVNRIHRGEMDRSPDTFVIEEIKELLASSAPMHLVVISRDINGVSHTLANFGRVQGRTMTWIKSGPVDVLELCRQDCIPDG